MPPLKFHPLELTAFGFLFGVVLFFLYFVMVQNCALTEPDLYTTGGQICNALTFSAPEWVLPR